MLPLRDDNPSRRFPAVTLLLIGANLAVFVYEISLGPRLLERFVFTYGAIPASFLHSSPGSEPFPFPWITLLTSMFLHGGIMHLVGNMLYLWIFGDNIEDTLGPVKFLLFYLLCGGAAASVQIALRSDSTAPMVGASGAIAGILGAYALLFPGHRIQTLVFVFVFVRIVPMPALVLLGLWFLMQVVSAPSSGGAGVAFFAHIGGFITGMLLVGLFPRGRQENVDT
ncbi:MAG TPA: rhomboid family intramembrane serine protease [Candidatus Polarisedimenticolia bacterium]|nr:rhomboid family intramembrane serine protease [Candidatus Polarisedimenticolia bacterium]